MLAVKPRKTLTQILVRVEMLRVLQDADLKTEYAVGVINWTKYVIGKRDDGFDKYLTAKRVHDFRYP